MGHQIVRGSFWRRSAVFRLWLDARLESGRRGLLIRTRRFALSTVPAGGQAARRQPAGSMERWIPLPSQADSPVSLSSGFDHSLRCKSPLQRARSLEGGFAFEQSPVEPSGANQSY